MFSENKLVHGIHGKARKKGKKNKGGILAFGLRALIKGL